MNEKERVPHTNPDPDPTANAQHDQNCPESPRVVYLMERRHRHERTRPWYNQGWVWLLLIAGAVMVIVWQLQSVTGALHN